jgi:hypothetical protein
MKYPETAGSLRLLETIPDFMSKLDNLRFEKNPHLENDRIKAEDIEKFLNKKISEQNQQYALKAKANRQRSGGYGSAFATPSNLTGFISSDKKTQIENLLDQATYNQNQGSFKSRNASGFNMAISESRKAISRLGKAFSSTSMSSGGDHQHQKTSSLQKSQSLSSQGQGKSDQKINYKKPNHQKNGESSKTRSPIVKNKSKTLGKRISDAWSRITFKKTKQQNIGTSRGSAKPNKVDPKLNRSSSFASSRSGPKSHSSNLSQETIASRNQSMSRSHSARSSQGSFSSQNSLGSGGSRGSGGSHASRVSQSRSGRKNSGGSIR